MHVHVHVSISGTHHLHKLYLNRTMAPLVLLAGLLSSTAQNVLAVML